MTQNQKLNCSLCGLLCSLDRADLADGLPDCTRVAKFTHQASLSEGATSQSFELENCASQIHQLLASAKRPLIWLDGADVLTTRAAVQLATKCQAVLHVPDTPGGRVVGNVTIDDGWLGTTLADMAEHSQLIITLGNSWVTQTPRLAQGWFGRSRGQPQRQWWHIDIEPLASGAPLSISTPVMQPDRRFAWKKSEWLQRFTEVAQLLVQSPGERSQPTEMYLLAQAIQASSNTTIVWETSQLSDPMDEILVHRLLTIATIRSRTARCNLLALESEIGYATAQETLLWLTGCHRVAEPVSERSSKVNYSHDGRGQNDSLTTNCENDHRTSDRTVSCAWRSPEYYADYDYSDWQQECDRVLLVRTVASLTPLPDIRSDATLCGQLQAARADYHQSVIPVALAGIDSDAFLLRGDRGMLSFLSANPEIWPNRHLASGREPIPASEILRRAAQLADGTATQWQPGTSLRAGPSTFALADREARR